jgi:hypothetical protein
MRGTAEDNILRCPFCGGMIEEPHEITGRFGNTFSGGICECGSVYVYDRSGHNLGDAYVDALGFAYNNSDEAWDAVPGEDYEIVELNYDQRRNRFMKGSPSRGKLTATFIFIRVKKSDE